MTKKYTEKHHTDNLASLTKWLSAQLQTKWM